MGVLVIGSGPAGVAATQALLARGLAVTLVDGGESLEGGIAAEVARLAESPQPWSPAQTGSLRGNLRADRHGVPQKTAFGSNFAQRGADFLNPASTVRTAASLAAGGLSNVWGASVLPWPAEELASWPLPSGALRPHFEALRDFIPVSGTHDGLDATYPWTTPPSAPSALSAPMQRLLAHWRAQAGGLTERGWRMGAARVAVDMGTCVRCALCLHGCPTGSIWNAGAQVRAWAADGRIDYQPGFRVDALATELDGVVVHATHRISGESKHFTADRVFLAAGTLPSSWILAKSLGRTRTTWKTSQYFLAPFLPAAASPGAMGEPRLTLAQAFLQLPAEAGVHRGAHLQFYGPNDIHQAAIARAAGPLASLLSGLTDRAADRLMSVQGYLHSDDSPGLEGMLQAGVMHLGPLPSPRAGPAVHAVTRSLWRERAALGGGVILPMVHVGIPGDGAHVGASWPMARRPTAEETDPLGSPVGLPRVHVVDASVLPAIAAPTITWTLMANAHRIASEVPL